MGAQGYAKFEHTPIPALVLRLGIPSMAAQFFNILYSIVDRIFVGNIPGDGSLALAAVGICAPLITAVTAFAMMVGIGGASCMSICMGRKDWETAQKTINNALLMLTVISLCVTAGILAQKKPLLYLLGCSDAMYPFAEKYLTIYITGTFASLCGLGLNQFILAQGRAKTGMISVVIGALCNVALDPLFIYGFHMGIAGAATATVVSQTVSMLFVICHLRKKDMPIRIRFGGYSAGMVKAILRIGIMPFLITVFDNMILILLNMQLRKYGGAQNGDTYIACAAVVQSFMVLAGCPGQGITSGCGTLFGYHYGAGNYRKVMQCYQYVFLLCLSYMLILLAVSQTAVQPFVRLFLNDPRRIGLASEFIRKYTIGLPGLAVQFALVDGTTAMGKVRQALPMSMFRKGVYIICIFILPLLTDLKNIFYAGTISDLAGSAFTVILFFTVIQKNLRADVSAGQIAGSKSGGV